MQAAQQVAPISSEQNAVPAAGFVPLGRPSRPQIAPRRAREVLASLTRAQTARLNNPWARTDGGRAAQLERQVMPLLASKDPTLQARGNMVLQDMIRMSPTRTAIAISVVRVLGPKQLKILAPASVALLMLAIHQVNEFSVLDLAGVQIQRGGDDWLFASTGEIALPRDGLVWRATRPTMHPTGEAFTAATELARQGPRTISYAMTGGRLHVRYMSATASAAAAAAALATARVAAPAAATG